MIAALLTLWNWLGDKGRAAIALLLAVAAILLRVRHDGAKEAVEKKNAQDEKKAASDVVRANVARADSDSRNRDADRLRDDDGHRRND